MNQSEPNNNSLNQIWDNMISSPNANLSVSSSTNGNKVHIKKIPGQIIKTGIQNLWIALTFATVGIGAVTLSEFNHRVDTIKHFAQTGKMDMSKEAFDTKFMVNHGANLKDSFLAGMNKLSHAYTNSEDLNITFENSLMPKKFEFIQKDDIIRKLQIKEAQKTEVQQINHKNSPQHKI